MNDLFTCRNHGPLPRSNFPIANLTSARHLCKRCMCTNTQDWIRRNPKRHLWQRFIRTAQKKFGTRLDLAWTEAEKIIDELIGGNYELHVLTWELGAKILDLTRLLVMSRVDSRHRGRRQHTRNK